MNYFLQNSVWVPPSWIEKRNSSLFNTLSSYITKEVDSILTTKEVQQWYAWSKKLWVYKINEWENVIWNNDFCYISDEDVHIKTTKESVKKWIKEHWKIIVNKEILEAYLRKWYINNDELINWVESYIYVTVLTTIEKNQLSLFAQNWCGEKILIQNYNVSLEYQSYLAYAIAKWWLEWSEMKKITDILSARWETVEYFIEHYFNNFLPHIILNKLLNKINISENKKD